jgi:alpha/beta superfamily hydrolase
VRIVVESRSPVPGRSLARASRTDAGRGIREECSFFGSRGDRCFSVLHLPLGKAAAGLVICSPYQAELLCNYRREVLQARRLAAEGIAVHRFHYRGSGHSDGETSHATMATMLADAEAAAAILRERAGVEQLAFLGTRWGGLVAAEAAERSSAPIALWEPVTDTARYVEEILRFKLTHTMKDGNGPTQDDLVSELHQRGSVDVLGHTLELTMLNSAGSHSLAGLRGGSSVFLAQVGVTRSLRREYRELVDRWRAGGADVETLVVPDREIWWLSGDRWPVHERHEPTDRLIGATTRWLLRQVGGSA